MHRLAVRLGVIGLEQFAYEEMKRHLCRHRLNVRDFVGAIKILFASLEHQKTKDMLAAVMVPCGLKISATSVYKDFKTYNAQIRWIYRMAVKEMRSRAQKYEKTFQGILVEKPWPWAWELV